MIRRAEDKTYTPQSPRPEPIGTAEEASPMTQTTRCDRDRQLSAAISRLTNLYEKSCELADYAVALRACKELHKLQGLEDPPAGADRIDPAEYQDMAGTLHRVREHLMPLGLASESYPIEEHARLAAGMVIELQCVPGGCR